VNQWLVAFSWLGLALAAGLVSVWTTISVSLLEIAAGVIGGNLLRLQPTDWANFLAGLGAVETIVRFCQEGGFDLLVVGFMGHSRIFERIWGSTSQNLTRLAPCSVLVAKEPRPDSVQGV